MNEEIELQNARDMYELAIRSEYERLRLAFEKLKCKGYKVVRKYSHYMLGQFNYYTISWQND